MTPPRDERSAYERPTVFVVGCPRSGTTWVRSILAAHGSIVSGPESHLFAALYGPATASGSVAQRKTAALDAFDRSVRGELYGPSAGPDRWVSRDVLSGLLDTYLVAGDDEAACVDSARQIFEVILEDYAAAAGADSRTILVEKTPHHLFHADTILGWWPSARIVEVVRDGRDVCVSLQHKAVVADWAPSDRAEQIRSWVRAVRRGEKLRERPQARGRWLTLRYEDLQNDAVANVQRLLAFVGLAVEEDAVNEIVARTDFATLPATGPDRHQRKGVVGDHHNHFTAQDDELFRQLAGEVFERAGYRF